MDLDKIKKEKDIMNKKLESLFEDIREVENKIYDLSEQEKELDDDFIKIKCPECDAYGYIVQGEGKSVCQLCFGKYFVWAKKYKG